MFIKTNSFLLLFFFSSYAFSFNPFSSSPIDNRTETTNPETPITSNIETNIKASTQGSSSTVDGESTTNSSNQSSASTADGEPTTNSSNQSSASTADGEPTTKPSNQSGPTESNEPEISIAPSIAFTKDGDLTPAISVGVLESNIWGIAPLYFTSNAVINSNFKPLQNSTLVQEFLHRGGNLVLDFGYGAALKWTNDSAGAVEFGYQYSKIDTQGLDEKLEIEDVETETGTLYTKLKIGMRGKFFIEYGYHWIDVIGENTKSKFSTAISSEKAQNLSVTFKTEEKMFFSLERVWGAPGVDASIRVAITKKADLSEFFE